MYAIVFVFALTIVSVILLCVLLNRAAEGALSKSGAERTRTMHDGNNFALMDQAVCRKIPS